ncbi:MAG TPA: reverse transcriptase family protein [Lacibacter sp.]|nr:reverse transcriptase family protein [Lacibacter sp.]HMO89865.1 reverse transcriptase family protein [Lacibacter sp.]
MLTLLPFDPKVNDRRLGVFLRCGSLEEVARCLCMEPEVVAMVLESDRNYHEFPLRKKKGGFRIIHSPARPLRDIQERLLPYLNRMYGSYVPSFVHGFVSCRPGRSSRNIVTNAGAHVGSAQVLNLDIRDFFPGITAEQVREALLHGPVAMHTLEAASIVALLSTRAWRLPAGSPVSPVLSNMVFYKTDYTLEALAKRLQWRYTRYADDLTFSSDGIITNEQTGEIMNALKEDGFAVHPHKVRRQSLHRTQYVTGLKVNKKVNVDRRYIRQLRAVLHSWEKEGLSRAAERYFGSRAVRFRNASHLQASFKAAVTGKIGFVWMVKRDEPVAVQLWQRLRELERAAVNY